MSAPSFSSQLKEVQDAILPLLAPPASTFTAPLLNNFAAAHDPLAESDSLFTAKADLGTVHVELDATLRTFARNAEAEKAAEEAIPGEGRIVLGGKDPASDTKQILELVRQAKLRSKLRGLAGGYPDGETSVRSQASITKASRLRKEAFDEEMEREEKEALEEFKRKLKESVLQT
ncbi:hypothetical protein AA313_de0205278 [Arthrobotrys entomopaga]|nr:hypothetical protein AA313_de0205278 [Arthrobotrys entomopaga]